MRADRASLPVVDTMWQPWMQGVASGSWGHEKHELTDTGVRSVYLRQYEKILKCKYNLCHYLNSITKEVIYIYIYIYKHGSDNIINGFQYQRQLSTNSNNI